MAKTINEPMQDVLQSASCRCLSTAGTGCGEPVRPDGLDAVGASDSGSLSLTGPLATVTVFALQHRKADRAETTK